METDILIVGAGIAGLRVATELLKSKPTLKILFIEMYKTVGGRIDTVKTGSTHYESGARGIHSSHRKVLEIVKSNNLNLTKIDSQLDWRSSVYKKTEKNDYYTLFKINLDILRSLPKEKLRMQTVRDLFIEILGTEMAKNILETYPYRSELETMSADSALDLFTTLNNGNFYIINEGFHKIPELLYEKLKKQNVEFKFDHEILKVEYDDTYKITALNKGKTIQIRANRIILAIPQKSLEKIYPFSPDHPLIKKVRMEPLLRIYSKYRTADWFPKHNIVTDSPLRYIIPCNRAEGLIMSSYLDARDIEPWLQFTKKEQQDSLKQKIQNETQNLFPELDIPKSIFTKAYLWRQGCSYWLPGDYDYREASKQALYPMPETYPKLHIVGESFSQKQQWVEGALEHADQLVKLILESI
jgi:hypothetical protein